MNLRDAAQQILDYAPHVETAWQGDGVCAVPIRYIIDLKRAVEAEKRVKTVPYDRDAALEQLRQYRENHGVVSDEQVRSILHSAMFGE